MAPWADDRYTTRIGMNFNSTLHYGRKLLSMERLASTSKPLRHAVYRIDELTFESRPLLATSCLATSEA